jgi:phosphoglycerate dehydrogenase-like enzyme
MTGATAPEALSAGQGTRPRIVVLDDWEQAMDRLADWSVVQALADVEFHHKSLKGEALVDAIASADALVLNRDRTPIDAALIEKLPRLKYVVFTGGRNRKIDYAALTQRNVPVSGTPGGPGMQSTVEQTWALILASTRRIESGLDTMRHGGWRTDSPWPMASVLHGQRMGLIGFGNIGRRVGAVGMALGMDVVTWSPNMTPARALEGGARSVPLDELLQTSRVISLHLVPSAATHGLIDATRLASMRGDALLVNTSRSELVDMPALLAALESKQIGGAALDVYPAEPVGVDDAIRRMPNLVLSPHVGFVADAVFTAFAVGVTAALTAWLRGEPLPGLIDNGDV